jgi:FAD/FMN-containing dehydrogenase
MSIPFDQFIAVVGPKNAITAAADMERYTKDWRGHYSGVSPLVLRPSSTQQVSDILKIAYETGTPIVPQSGNTGLVGGSTPSGDTSQVVLSLDRMTKIIEVDAVNNTMTVEAGAILKNIQSAADAVDRLFPLSLASEGTCRIGGNLSTNAGGLNVLAYGNARELCLGLEVVLADGRIWDGLRKLRKDNTGYDLKNMFIGAEGTLGVITGAVLKLFPKPRRYETAFIAVPTPQAALDLLHMTQHMSDNRAIAFELMPEIALQFVTTHTDLRRPLDFVSPWYVLMEIVSAPEQIGDPMSTMDQILQSAVNRGMLTDAVIAQSEAQRQSLWGLREAISDTQRLEGDSIKNDVAVPVSHIPQLVTDATRDILAYNRDARIVSFGHMGDGNLHFNISQPIGWPRGQFLAHWDRITGIVEEHVLKLGGTISAEHGIGRMKRNKMNSIKSAVELQMMRDLKTMLDPTGILNPGKVLPD